MDPAYQLKLLTTALAHHQANRLDEAEAIYRRVLAEHPHNIDALHLLGVVFSARGKPQEALPLLQQAAALNPQFIPNLRDLASVLGHVGRHQESLNCYLRAVQAAPRDAMLRADMATTLLALNRHAEALAQLRSAVELDPTNALILGNYGFMLGRTAQHDQAFAVLRRAVEMAPSSGTIWAQLAESLWRAARYPEAVEPAQRAAALLPNDPRILIMLGNTFQTNGQLEEAAQAYRQSIELDAGSFDSRNNLALTLLKMGEAREAARMYEQILARWPDARDALANQSLALLTLGDLEKGLANYEARAPMATLEADRRAGRLWDGRDPRGKVVMLASEQGFGDTIHFVRYAPLVAERGATVLVGCPPELVPVISTVRGITRVFPVGSPMPAYDFIVPMGSLPKVFGTRIDAVPNAVPYMSADAQRVERWRQRLAGDAKIKVGIAWAGSGAHQNDRARSCRLADFAPFGGVEGVTLYSLQKGAPAEELKSAPPGLNVIPLGQDLNEFGDTAALLQCLDLLISVDTSVVHLAGALARPVWTLIARGPDWRWMIEREDTPWYPTMRLLRQQKLKDWPPVLERAAEELRKFVLDRRRPKE